MTLFKKLAGKASALLNASGICSNNCIEGHCSGCGECCADLLPLTKGEIKRLRDYARKHRLQENGLLYNYGACNGGAVAPACILNPKYLNLRQSMAYVEEVSE